MEESKDDAVPGCSSKMHTDPELIYIRKTRGTVIHYKGHKYYKNRTFKDGSAAWRCSTKDEDHGLFNCTGSLKIQDGVIVNQRPHTASCVPDFARNEIELKMVECRNKVIENNFQDSVPNIFNQTVGSLKDSGIDLIRNIPSYGKIKTALYDARNKAAGIKKVCNKNASDVEVPTQFENFVMGDFNDEGERILVFCHPQIRPILGEITHFLADGTYKSCPEPFTQLYCIHGDFRNDVDGESNVLPLVYALMTGKSTDSYQKLFEIVKSQVPEWQPQKFTFDFEEAAMKAIGTVFHDVEIKGCYFHYKNSIFRKGKVLKLTKLKQSKRILQLAGNMALLPIDKIEEGWDYVKQQMDILSNNGLIMAPFINYMEKFWLRSDSFIKIWSVYGQELRTTNNVESWHLRINNNCKTRGHLNIVQLLVVLHKDAALNVTKTRLINSAEPGRKNRRISSLINDEFINEQQIKLANAEISTGHFLESLR